MLAPVTLHAQDRHLSDTAAQPVSYNTSLTDCEDCAAPASCGCESCTAIAACDDCACDTGGSDCEPWTLFNQDNCYGIGIGGWISAGYHSQSNGQFNNRPDEFNLHQAWLYAERVADGSCGLDWGFRVDAMYGIDGTDTQAFGNNPGNWDYQNGFDHGPYSFALPQAYVELAAGDLSLKIGHFFTLVGYEVVPAPDNFFYSHAFTMYNSEPFTHTGVLATYNWSEDTTLYGGWTLGWDTGFDQFGQGNSFLGGFSTTLMEDITFTYIATYGDFGWRGEADSYSHSIVLDVALTENLNYVLQSDLMDARGIPSLNQVGVDTFGINQYLFYTINDCWKAGGRMEWYKIQGVSIYEATAGLNYKPHSNLTIRPEYRYEWVPSLGADQSIFGIDAVFTF